MRLASHNLYFFFQAEDGIRDDLVTGVQTCALPISQSVVRGQYSPGKIGDKPVPGYREEPNVNPVSKTETSVAAKILIDNWRWAGGPFYLRTGKRLAKRTTEIMIQFRRAPHIVLREQEI